MRNCLACQDEFFVNSPLILTMFLTLLFTCLAFFGLGEFGLAIQPPVYDSCFLPQTLVQVHCHTSFENVHKI
jgi:hypothetical protein